LKPRMWIFFNFSIFTPEYVPSAAAARAPVAWFRSECAQRSDALFD
jgi:hypothetical protein